MVRPLSSAVSAGPSCTKGMISFRCSGVAGWTSKTTTPISPLPRWCGIRPRPDAPVGVSRLTLETGVLGRIRGVLFVIPPVTAPDEHRAQVATLDVCAGHSAAVAANVLYLHSNVSAAHVAACGPCGSLATGVGSLRSIHTMKANGDRVAT